MIYFNYVIKEKESSRLILGTLWGHIFLFFFTKSGGSLIFKTFLRNEKIWSFNFSSSCSEAVKRSLQKKKKRKMVKPQINDGILKQVAIITHSHIYQNNANSWNCLFLFHTLSPMFGVNFLYVPRFVRNVEIYYYHIIMKLICFRDFF